MKEVNSLSRQEAGEEHKNNGNKEVFYRDNKSYTEIEEELRMAKAIVSQYIILCYDKQLNKRQELEKKSIS